MHWSHSIDLHVLVSTIEFHCRHGLLRCARATWLQSGPPQKSSEHSGHSAQGHQGGLHEVVSFTSRGVCLPQHVLQRLLGSRSLPSLPQGGVMLASALRALRQLCDMLDVLQVPDQV